MLPAAVENSQILLPVPRLEPRSVSKGQVPKKVSIDANETKGHNCCFHLTF